MINLVIKDVIEDKFFLKGNILNLLKKCRDLVGLFNHSNLLAPKLANVMMKVYKRDLETYKSRKQYFDELLNENLSSKGSSRKTSDHNLYDSICSIDPYKSFGTIIGKALMPLNSGKGLIPILVNLA